MPYGTPEIEGGNKYWVRIADANDPDNLVAAIEFDSSYVPAPAEAAKDAFMQRVIDTLVASPDFVFQYGQKVYAGGAAITPTP